METTYTVNDDVEVYINDSYDVKVKVKNYLFDYVSASFTDYTGWQLDLNDNIKYTVKTKDMADGLLAFLTTNCSPVRLKKLKNSLLREYTDFITLLDDFVEQDDEISKFDTNVKFYNKSENVATLTRVEVQIESSRFLNCWSAYLRYRKYGTGNKRAVSNYFFNRVNVSFLRVNKVDKHGQ